MVKKVLKGVGKGVGLLVWPMVAVGSLVTGRGRGRDKYSSAAEAEFDDIYTRPSSLPPSVPASEEEEEEMVALKRRPVRSGGSLATDLWVVWGCGGREGGRKAKAVVVGVVGLSVLTALARVAALVCLGQWVQQSVLSEAFDFGMGGKEGGREGGREGETAGV